ncbi:MULTISPECIES: FAD assembly factor SdhE [Nitrincola]|uniref:FAD assembly factor SdhE n=1 Tax=Nitrincola nitratireducens TaxID=1229521 RepID=W9VM10_9GAMM|nr:MULTISPECIES: succinate dehydrogenase assembly factor 2 [Nitrincola]EXJ11560.1 hypothetical protein D791_01333 [Nitrincola nitratireducens]
MYTEEDIRRLTWQCRRGMLELDVLLGPFVETTFRSLNEADQRCFVRLLDCEDQDLFTWLMQRGESEDADIQRMVRMILERVQPS